MLLAFAQIARIALCNLHAIRAIRMIFAQFAQFATKPRNTVWEGLWTICQMRKLHTVQIFDLHMNNRIIKFSSLRIHNVFRLTGTVLLEEHLTRSSYLCIAPVCMQYHCLAGLPASSLQALQLLSVFQVKLLRFAAILHFPHLPGRYSVSGLHYLFANKLRAIGSIFYCKKGKRP